MKKLLQSSAFSILSNIMQLLVSLGSGIIIARSLGTTGKGEIFLITQVMSLVQVIFSFGFGPSILYYLKRNETKPAEVNYFIFGYILILAVLFAVSLVFFDVPIKNLVGGDLSVRLIILAFGIAYINILALFVGYKIMSTEHGVKSWSISNLVSNIFYLCFLAGFIMILKMGVLGALYALVISSLIKLIMLLYFGRPNMEFSVISKINLKKISFYGIQIFMTNLFLTSVFRIDTFFLNKMVSLSDLGLYSVSVNVGELLLLIPSAIGVALFPHLSGLSKEEQLDAMSLVGRVSFLIGFAGIIGLSIIGYPFILIVFGRNFLPAFTPFLFLLPGLMAMTVNYSYSNYFSSIGKPIVGGIVFFIGLIFNVILNLLLIPKMGISGAAITSSITYIIITTCFVLKIKQMNDLSVKEFLFPKKSDLVYIKEKVMTFINKK